MTRKLDATLLALGLAFGAPSLVWPFGWDTSVHYYVGREWLLRGALPYRDSFDHKTPGIHALHALAIALFGEGMAGIRVVELAMVVVLGCVCAAIARGPRGGGRATAGLLGASVLFASVFYYGFYDYWNTAQCELAATTCAAASVAAALRARSLGRAAALAGLLTGIAVVLKPPFALFAFVAATVLASRARRGQTAARVLGIAVVGAAAVPAVAIVYFAARGGLRDLIDVVVFANAVYVENEPRLSSVADVAGNVAVVWRGYSPVAALVFGASAVACALAIARRSRARLARWAIAAGMLGAGYAVIAVQLKFYYYHWITLLPACTVMAASVVVDAARRLRSTRPWAPAVASAAVLAAFALTGPQASGWARTTTAAAHWIGGDWDRARFASTFATWDGVRRYADVEAVGRWIAARSSPTDELLVRGVAAEVYVVSGLHAPGRFFWTAFLTRDSRRFHREAWLAEDAAVVDARAARWVVTWTATTDGVESAGFFQDRGYVERTRIGAYTVLERAPAAASPAARR